MKNNFLTLEFMMIVARPDIAEYISRFKNITIFFDLEILGKNERQGHLDTVKSSSEFSDVDEIRKAAPEANLLVRINPLNRNSESEINSVIKSGANSIMLPMFRQVEEVEAFLGLIDGRAKAVPLFETSESINNLPEIITKLKIEQLHIGLNDLHIDQNKSFLFEPLSDGFLEEACAELRARKVKFGIGGIAKAGDGLLSPEFILGEHVRLGSSVAILSRAFHNNAKDAQELSSSFNFKHELEKLQEIYKYFQLSGASELDMNKIKTWELIKKIANKIEN